MQCLSENEIQVEMVSALVHFHPLSVNICQTLFRVKKRKELRRDKL